MKTKSVKDVIEQPQARPGVACSDLFCIGREQLLTSLYLGVQLSLYAITHPEVEEVLPGMHICHYHQNSKFQHDVDMTVHCIIAELEGKMQNK